MTGTFSPPSETQTYYYVHVFWWCLVPNPRTEHFHEHISVEYILAHWPDRYSSIISILCANSMWVWHSITCWVIPIICDVVKLLLMDLGTWTNQLRSYNPPWIKLWSNAMKNIMFNYFSVLWSLFCGIQNLTSAFCIILCLTIHFFHVIVPLPIW